MLKRKVAITVALAAVLVLAGCTDELLKVAQAAKDFSVAVKTLQQAEIQAHDLKLTITDEQHVDIQRIFIDVANSGKELDNAINVAHSKPQALVALKAAIASLDRLLNEGVIKITDEKTKTELSLAIVGAKGILDSISAVVGGK